MRNCPHPRVAPARNAQRRGTAAASWLYAEAVHSDRIRSISQYLLCTNVQKRENTEIPEVCTSRPAPARRATHSLTHPGSPRKASAATSEAPAARAHSRGPGCNRCLWVAALPPQRERRGGTERRRERAQPQAGKAACKLLLPGGQPTRHANPRTEHAPASGACTRCPPWRPPTGAGSLTCCPPCSRPQPAR